MFEPITEDEHHVLKYCTLYEDLRQSLSPLMRNDDPTDLFKTINSVRDTARFLVKVNKRRFPSPPDEKRKAIKATPTE